MKITIKLKIQFFYTNLLCLFLFVKNLLFSRKLRVKNFLYTTQLTLRGNETELNWNVVGCHKITISNLFILPGNLSQKKIKLEDKINDLEITFNGIGGQKQTKRITVESISPLVLNTFTPKMKLSNLSSVPLVRKDLKKTLDNTFNYQTPKKIKPNKPKIISRKLTINFKSFIKSNYPINQ
jgi:hypothetical protein